MTLKQIAIIAAIALVLILVFTIIIRRTSTKRKIIKSGKLAEKQLYNNLNLSTSKRLLSCYLPTRSGGTTEADVILIHPNGLFVYECKNLRGRIVGNESSEYWSRTYSTPRGVEKESFYNPVKQNNGHVGCLRELIGKDYPVYSVIAFNDNAELDGVSVYDDSVSITKISEAQNVPNHYPNALSQKEIKELYKLIKPTTKVSRKVKREHLKSIKKNH